MSLSSTPIATRTGGKRELTSPEDSLDPKKNKIHGESTSDADVSIILKEAGIGETFTEATDTVANITLDKPAYDGIAEALKDSFMGEIKELMTSSIHGIVDSIIKGVVEGLNNKILALENDNISLKAANKALEVRVTELEKLDNRCDELEQYSRRNILRVTGIPENRDEDTDKHILDVCKSLSLNLDLKDIDRSHRVGKVVQPDSRGSTIRPRSIIVKFSTYRARNLLYKARTHLRSSGFRNVFINEDLTRTRNTLLYEARKLAKSGKINSCWSSDGSILVKDNSSSTHKIGDINSLRRFGYVPS